MSVKEEILKFVQELPDDSSLDDIEYYLYVRRKIEQGRETSRRGDVITQEEFEKEMNEWSERSFGRSLL